MKVKILPPIVIFFFIIASSLSYGQHTNKFFTKEKLQIKGNKAFLYDNENNALLQFVFLNDPKPNYFFENLEVHTDPSGNYIATLEYKYDGNADVVNIYFCLEFDKPVISVKQIINGKIAGRNESITKNKLFYYFGGFISSSDQTIKTVIKSKTPIFIKINGLNVREK